ISHPRRFPHFPYTTLFRSAKTTSGYGSFESFQDKTEEILEVAFQRLKNREEKQKAQEEALRREREERKRQEAWAKKWAEMPEERSEEHTSELQSRENLVCR